MNSAYEIRIDTLFLNKNSNSLLTSFSNFREITLQSKTFLKKSVRSIW